MNINWHKTDDYTVAVLTSCAYCSEDILFAFFTYDVMPDQKFVKYLCKCGFETLIPIQDEWRLINEY